MLWIESGLGYSWSLWFNRLGDNIPIFILNLFNFIGNELFYILLFPLIYWCINKSIGKRALIITLLTAYVSSLFKYLLVRPQPFDLYSRGSGKIINRVLVDEEYGFPSSYTMGITSLWLYFSSISKKISVKILSILVILLTGLVRVISGGEFIFTMFLSILFSILILVIFKIFEPKITTLCNQRYSVSQRVLLILFFSIAAIVIVLLINITSIEIPLILVGCFLGTTTGIVLEKEYIHFSVDGSLILRIGRYFFGIIIISVVYYGIEFLYNISALDNNFILFVKYSVLTFIITFPLPKLFIYMNLSRDSLRTYL